MLDTETRRTYHELRRMDIRASSALAMAKDRTWALEHGIRFAWPYDDLPWDADCCPREDCSPRFCTHKPEHVLGCVAVLADDPDSFDPYAGPGYSRFGRVLDSLWGIDSPDGLGLLDIECEIAGQARYELEMEQRREADAAMRFLGWG